MTPDHFNQTWVPTEVTDQISPPTQENEDQTGL